MTTKEAIKYKIGILCAIYNLNINKLSKYLGCSYEVAKSLVNGTKYPSSETMERVRNRFGVSPTWLTSEKGYGVNTASRELQIECVYAEVLNIKKEYELGQQGKIKYSNEVTYYGKQ